MNHQPADLLDRVLADLPVRPASVDGLLRAGRRARRRRRTAAVTGVAAATALVLAGTTIGLGGAGGAGGPGGRAGQEAGDPAAPSEPAPVDLPTNGWEPGDASRLALATGVLGLDAEGCVVLDGGAGSRTYATWPAGYTADVEPGGAVHLRDADGDEVARGGQRVRVGGGYGSATRHPHPCLPSGAEVFHVQSDVVLVPRTRATDGPDADGEGGAGVLLDGAGNETLPVGATAPLTVFAHCGLRFARIDATLWETDERGNGSSPTGSDLLRGTATRTAEDRVVFTSAGLADPVVFRPAEPDPHHVCY